MAETEQRQITPGEAWQISCHEAGHAVVGVHRQIPFFHVERGDGEHGQVPFGVPPSFTPDRKRAPDEIRRWQEFYAAGAAAELLLFGRYRHYAARQDQANHEELKSFWQPKRIDGWEQDIKGAMSHLDPESVVKVATELDRRRKLSAKRVYELLGCPYPW